MNIACSTDDKYAAHCATMLHSLLSHNKSIDNIYLLHDENLNASSKQKLSSTVAQFAQSLTFLPITKDIIGDLPSKHFHISCWYRVLLPHLLPKEGKVLYLDADMVIRQDLTPLWESGLESKQLFAAVVNPLYPFMPNRIVDELGLSSAQEYLNSGMLLMNLRAMRKAGVEQALRNYASDHPDNIWPEQDALSVVCRGRWKPVSPKWNAQTTIYDLEPDELPFDNGLVTEARQAPAVIHFIGPLKPWTYLCMHPYKRFYKMHRLATPWADFQLEQRKMLNFFLRHFSLENQIAIKSFLCALRARF